MCADGTTISVPDPNNQGIEQVTIYRLNIQIKLVA